MTATAHTPQFAPAPSGSVGLAGSVGLNETPLGAVLDQVRGWLERFIATTDDLDLDLLTLWAAHTHVCAETWTTPRLILDSVMPGSGKTTTLEHLQHLTYRPVPAASVSSAALLARLLAKGPRTIMIDEADRNLDEHDPDSKELLAVINSGYKAGATRPVLVPVKEGGWEAEEMPTFGPVVMAGNAPNLPGDTRSRAIRVLLMPDIDGTIEDSDWEDIAQDADQLGVALAENLDAAREQIKAARPDLPEGCRGRMREKWRPLARVADVAGGCWPETVRKLILRDMAEVAAEAADGVAKRPPAYVLLEDLRDIWDQGEAFLPTTVILDRLAEHRPDYWGEASPYGKKITAQRFSRMVTQAGKIHSDRDATRQRGYFREAFGTVWRRVPPTPSNKPTEPTEATEPGTGGLCPHGADDPDLCAECGGATGSALAGGDGGCG